MKDSKDPGEEAMKDSKDPEKKPTRYKMYDKIKFQISLKTIDIIICIVIGLILVLFLFHFFIK